MAAPSDWRNGLFSQVCGGSAMDCLGSWCCTPCMFGRVSSRFHKFPESRDEALDTMGFNGDCFGFYCIQACCGMGFIPLMMRRGDVRRRFGIQGDGFTDCMLSCFCQPCALSQMSTELKDRSGATLPLNEKPVGYASQQGGMTYEVPSQHTQQGYPHPPQSQQQLGGVQQYSDYKAQPSADSVPTRKAVGSTQQPDAIEYAVQPDHYQATSPVPARKPVGSP